MGVLACKDAPNFNPYWHILNEMLAKYVQNVCVMPLFFLYFLSSCLNSMCMVVIKSIALGCKFGFLAIVDEEKELLSNISISGIGGNLVDNKVFWIWSLMFKNDGIVEIWGT